MSSNRGLALLLGILSLAIALIILRPASARNSSLALSDSAPATGVNWVKFNDSAEHAFALEVPGGWTARGGVFRLGYSDVRSMVDVTSPGRANIRLGDVAIPTYFLPNQFHHEGEVYDLGAQAQGIVARYRTGQVYARLYALARFTGLCRTLTPQPVNFPPAVRLSIDKISPEHSTEGQLEYRCDSNHGSRLAYVYAKTAQAQGLWQVVALGSFLVPAAQVDEAREILLHMSESLQVRPEWEEYQKKMDAEGLAYERVRQQQRLNALQQQVQQFEAKMQAMRNQVNAFERRQSARQAQFEAWDKAFIGVTSTTDPLDGTKRDVWTGPKSGYWINGTGTVVNSTDSPGPGWHALQADSQ